MNKQKNNYKILITIKIKKRNLMNPIDVFQTFRFQIYMEVLNDETIEQQNQFIQWTTRLPGQIKMQ